MIFIQGQDTIESVLAIRQRAIDSLGGGQVVSWSVEGASATKLITMKADELIEECNEFLRLVAPDLFGRRIKRTLPLYL